MPKELMQAVHEGIQAFHDGVPREQNPYTPLSADHLDWDAGWVYAQVWNMEESA